MSSTAGIYESAIRQIEERNNVPSALIYFSMHIQIRHGPKSPAPSEQIKQSPSLDVHEQSDGPTAPNTRLALHAGLWQEDSLHSMCIAFSQFSLGTTIGAEAQELATKEAECRMCWLRVASVAFTVEPDTEHVCQTCW
jgi:hypothetical protein